MIQQTLPPAVIDILAHMTDRARFPTMDEILSELKKALGLDKRQLAANLGLQPTYISDFQRHLDFSEKTFARFVTDGLRLPQEALEKLLQEQRRRYIQRFRHHEIAVDFYRMPGDQCRELVMQALRHYDIPVETFLKEAQGTPPEAIWYLVERENVLTVFRKLLNDPTYDADALISDGCGASLPLRMSSKDLSGPMR